MIRVLVEVNRAQRDTALKLIVIDFAEIQNWGRCR